ncbi:hypothetical protein IKE71_03810 [Candidatus Saccharibacteria bacterium]|nr:hypothetical protein [Candidatus Saccharibacteria bacterium]
MIITGTTLLEWSGFGGTIPSVVFEGRELQQRTGAAMDNPLYPYRANARYNSGAVKLGDLPSLWKITAEGVADTYDSQSGEYIQQVGQTAFDGSENWIYSATYHYFRTQMLDMATLNWNTNCACSHGVPIISSSQIGVRFGANNNWVYFYVGADSPLTSVALFKAWLSDQAANGTPLTIYYPLAATTTTTEAAQPLTANIGANTISLTSGAAVNVTANVRTLDDLGLITDRTYADVERLARLLEKIRRRTGVTSADLNALATDQKGALNASDLNRICTGIEWLGDEYLVPVASAPTFAVGDRPTPSQIAAILSDLLDIRESIPRTPLDPPLPSPPDKANDWQSLNLIESLIKTYHEAGVS